MRAARRAGARLPRGDRARLRRRDGDAARAGRVPNGQEVTDNVNRYAIRMDGDARVELAYYEVVKWGDDFRVDLQLQVQRR